jgi:methylmalonyl-CoA epimerase
MPRLDHLGIAVADLGAACKLYRELGFEISGIEEIPHEQVRVAMLPSGGSRIELLESMAPDSAVGRFIASRGPGLHHYALGVDDLAATVARLKAGGARLVNDQIQTGAGGHRYVFVHPSSAGGVLLEIVENGSVISEPRKPGGSKG